MPKKSIKYYVLGIKQSFLLYVKIVLLNTYYLKPNTNPQRGFAILPLIILMLVGITAGTLLVQNRTNFLPKAQSDLCQQMSATCEEQGKVCQITPDGEPICVRVISNRVAICTPEIILRCDERGQSCRANANNQPECYSPIKNTACTPEIISRCDSQGQTCVTNQNNEPICVNRTTIGTGSCRNGFGGGAVGTAWDGPCSSNAGYRIRYYCSSNENIAEGAINDDSCNPAPRGGCRNSYGGGAVNTAWDGPCSDKPGYKTKYYCSGPDNITEDLRNDDTCTAPAAGQPATATGTQKSACIQAQEAGAEIKYVCNLNGTKYCDNSTTLVTRAGGNCAASNQQADSRGCAYNYEKKNCAANEKCNDPGDGKASCIPKTDPRPAAATRTATGGSTDPIVTNRQPAAGSEAASRQASTGCENFKDSEGILSIPCYKIGVFTPDELKATEAQAKVALERYTQYKSILSEVGAQIDSAIKAKAEEKIARAEELAKACIARS